MSRPVILFICWGNVCRSPMAEMVARAKAAIDHLAVDFRSAGVSDEEAGHPMDSRARNTLIKAGYIPDSHTAHLVTAEEVHSADMVIGMERAHLSRLHQLVPGANHLYLLSDFDPDTPPGSEIEDPWYGEEADFQVTLHQIEGAMPELMKRARELLR